MKTKLFALISNTAQPTRRVAWVALALQPWAGGHRPVGAVLQAFRGLFLAALCILPVLAPAQSTFLLSPNLARTNLITADNGDLRILGGDLHLPIAHSIRSSLGNEIFGATDNPRNTFVRGGAIELQIDIGGGVLGRTALFVDGNSNVGLGTTNPTTKLDVAGRVRCESIELTGLQGTRLSVANYKDLRIEGGLQIPNGYSVHSADGPFSLFTVGGDLFLQPYVGNGDNVIIGGSAPGGAPSKMVNLIVSGQTIANGGINCPGKVTCQVLEVTSDRNAKANFRSLNLPQVLDKIADLEISEWEYTNAPGVRHFGAMAQDFHRAFGLGSDDKHINPLDAASVALAGVQALAREIKEKDAQIVELKTVMKKMEQQLAANSALMEKVVAQLSAVPRGDATALPASRSSTFNQNQQ